MINEKLIWTNLARLFLAIVIVSAISFTPFTSKLIPVGFNPFYSKTASAATENLTADWVETDPEGDLAITGDTAVAITTMAANVTAHVVRDYGSAHFSGNFSHVFQINIGSFGGSNSLLGYWMLSDNSSTESEADSNNEGLVLMAVGTSESLRLWDYSTDEYHSFGSQSGSLYVRMMRENSTLTCELYTDAEMTDLSDSGSITCDTTAFEQVTIAFSRGDLDNDASSGNIYNLDFQEDIPWFSSTNATNIGTDNATLGTMIWGFGGSNIAERGFEWGETSGVYTDNWTETGSWQEGDYSHQITGLSPGAVYFRALAKTDLDIWEYTNEVAFDTYEVTNPVVDNSTSAYSVRMPHEERILYTQGRWWVFYGAEDNDDEQDPKIKFKTSTDNGTTWTAPTTIRDGYYEGVYGNHGAAGFDTVLDSNGDFHYSYGQNSDLYYRKGTPDASGNITWVSAEVKIWDQPTNDVYHSTITANSTSHPWVVSLDESTSSVNATSSSTNDGTWTEAQSAEVGSDDDFMIIPLSSNKFYLLENDNPTDGRLYDGSSWGSEEGLEIYLQGFPNSFGMAADASDNVHMVAQNGTQHLYMIRNYGVGWGSPEVIADNITANSSPVLCQLDNDAFLIVWAGGEDAGEDHKLYYRYGTSGNWTDITELQDESINLLTRHDNLSLSRQEEDAGIGLVYGTGEVHPYEIRFIHIDPESLAGAGISIPTVTTQNATSVEETTSTGNGNITATGGENCTERGHEYDIDSGSPYSSNTTNSGSFSTGNFTTSLTGLTPGELYYSRAFAGNSAGYGYGSEVTFLTKPNGATGLTEIATTNTSVTLNWSNGSGMDYVEIRYSDSGYVVDNTTGTLGYWGSSTSNEITGLSANTTYYFSLYTHVTEGGFWNTADTVAQDTAYTQNPTPSITAEPMGAGEFILRYLVPIPIALGICILGLMTIGRTMNWIGLLISLMIGVMAYFAVSAILSTL